ncbi:hypothetical protein K8R30_03745 [archaeon]|nr:hypothetical protein [archaeon]
MKKTKKSTPAKKTSPKEASKAKIPAQHYWMLSTVVLAILLLVVSFTSCGGLTGAATISADEAGQKVLEFAKAQGAEAEFVSASDDGSLYEIVLSIDGQEIPVYVTKDGKTLVPQPIPLDAEPETAPAEETPAPANIPQSNKPIVEAFVMSHCPYGTQIEKGLIPVVEVLGDKIDFELKFVYYAMHPSAGEVEEQLNQYCIQKNEKDKFNDYLICFLTAGDGAGCIDETGINKATLSACVDATDKAFNVIANLEDTSSWLSGKFPKFDIHKAENEKYQIGGSPTLIINGVKAQAGRDSISLLNAICGAFNVAPEECNTEFEAVSPTPGFGWSTTETANNDAACGV